MTRASVPRWFAQGWNIDQLAGPFGPHDLVQPSGRNGDAAGRTASARRWGLRDRALLAHVTHLPFSSSDRSATGPLERPGDSGPTFRRTTPVRLYRSDSTRRAKRRYPPVF